MTATGALRQIDKLRETEEKTALGTMPRRPRRSGVQVGLLLASSVIGIVVLFALVPGLFSPHNHIAGVPTDRLQAPTWAHPFGTDALGRDLWSRVVHGAGQSLSGAFIAVTLGIVAGVLLGVLAGSLGGITDAVIMRMVDVLLAIPGLLLILTVVILLGHGTLNAAIAVGVSSVAAFARLTRSEVLRVRRAPYVEAAYGSGGRTLPILLRHVLPNSLTPVLALAAVQFGTAVLAIATLGFLGFGTPPPTPEWGSLIAEGRDYLATSWWLTTLPGIVVLITVLAANRISQSLGRRTR
jgi:peptide/nickel transport system permease protein